MRPHFSGLKALLAYEPRRTLIEATVMDVEITLAADRYVLVLGPPRDELELLGFDW